MFFVFRDSYVLYVRLWTLCTFHISVSWVWYTETKMADARTQIFSLGKPLARRTTWSVLKTTSSFVFRPAFLEPTPRHVFSINTSSTNTLPLFHIFTCRANTLSLVWLPERMQSLSLIHQQTSNATKCIGHANFPFLSIPCLWHVFQLWKQQLCRTTERNEH